MKQIKDLGFLYTSNTKKYKKRFGIYECPYCGTHFKGLSTHINQKNIKSCGCLKKINNGARTHGKSNKTRVYIIWKNMRQRCNNPLNINYKNYGGRGISICKEWNNFVTFENWALNNGYKDFLSIDRINNNGSYEPSNCRWATNQQQADNKRELRINNKTGHKGINFCKRDKLYHSRVTLNNKRITVGYYKDIDVAIKETNAFKQKNSL